MLCTISKQGSIGLFFLSNYTIDSPTVTGMLTVTKYENRIFNGLALYVRTNFILTANTQKTSRNKITTDIKFYLN